MAQKVTQALIYQELQSIKETLKQHSEIDNNNFKELTEDFRGLRQILEGSDASPGMKIRLDRIEQREDGRKRQFGYVWTVITLLLGAVLSMFTSQCTLPLMNSSVPTSTASTPSAGSGSSTAIQ